MPEEIQTVIALAGKFIVDLQVSLLLPVCPAAAHLYRVPQSAISVVPSRQPVAFVCRLEPIDTGPCMPQPQECATGYGLAATIHHHCVVGGCSLEVFSRRVIRAVREGPWINKPRFPTPEKRKRKRISVTMGCD